METLPPKSQSFISVANQGDGQQSSAQFHSGQHTTTAHTSVIHLLAADHNCTSVQGVSSLAQ